MTASFAPETKEFLGWLRQNKPIRDRISALPDKTLLYAGRFFRPVWKELDEIKRQHKIGMFTILPDVLDQIPGPGGSASIKQHVVQLEARVPWLNDGVTIWRALSGIYASNAVGKVWFSIGSGVDQTKVFAATEIHVLARNPNLDPTTREVVLWLQKCVQTRSTDINFGLMPSR